MDVFSLSSIVQGYSFVTRYLNSFATPAFLTIVVSSLQTYVNIYHIYSCQRALKFGYQRASLPYSAYGLKNPDITSLAVPRTQAWQTCGVYDALSFGFFKKM